MQSELPNTTGASKPDGWPHWLWQLVRSGSLVSWLAENVAFISWNKHWKGVYLHCVHPKYCVRLFAWGVDWHLKAKHALRKPANTQAQPPARDL